MKSIVTTFGRMQPPTIGHAKLVNRVISLAKELGAEHRIYLSKSHDSTNNPIPYANKVAFVRKLFPGANVVDDPKVSVLHHMMRKLSDEGYGAVTLVVGQDRVADFSTQIGKYVKKDTETGYDPKKHYNFQHFRVASAGDRDPDAEGVEGVSGTKMRKFAQEGDFKSFAKGTPTKNIHLAREIYNDVLKNLKKEIREDLDHKTFGPMLDSFVDFASGHLGLQAKPLITLKKDDQGDQPSFGGYNPSKRDIVVSTKNRHPMDIYRTVAHELVHHKQNEDERLKDIGTDGATGSDIENEANAEAGKIMRHFAKKQPDAFSLKFVTESALPTAVINEGLNDPSTFKAVFLAGGPGSGKDYIMKQTIAGNGLTEINSDVSLEFLMKKSGLSLLMPSEEESERNLVRGRAKNITHEKNKLAMLNRQGLIINGTADDPDKIVRIKSNLESMGYDCMMVFVDTDDEVSKARNIARGQNGGRTVPENIRKAKWNQTQEVKESLRNIFGDKDFVTIQNNADARTASPEQLKDIQQEFTKVYKKVRAFTKEAPTKKSAYDWIRNEAEKRGITKFAAPKTTVVSAGRSLSAKIAARRISNASVPESEAERLGLTYYGFGRYGKSINGANLVTHISRDGRLIPKNALREETMKKKEHKISPLTAARNSGSMGYKLDNGKTVSTRLPGESPQDHEKKMHIARTNNLKAPHPKPKVQTKPEKPGTPTENPVGSVVRDKDGQPFTAHVKLKNMDKAFKIFAEASGVSAREWGKPSLTKIYSEETPGEPGSDGPKKIYKGPSQAPGAGVGPEVNANALFEDQLPDNKSIRTWALKEETRARFVAKYGANANAKLLEAAKKLSSIA